MKLYSLVLTALLLNPFSEGRAQDYPSRPVRLIVPVPPGGGQDIMARTLAQKLSEAWTQTVVVDNRSGASAIVGTEMLARSAPDGYSLILISSTHVIAPSLNKVPYDPVNDFTPISQVSSQPYLMGVHPSLPAKSVREFVEVAKAKSGQLNYGSAGNGTAVHLAGELFKLMTGTRLTHIPYKGGGPALLALISGEIALLFASLPTMLPQAKAGKVRVLAVTSKARAAAAPGLPTVSESGLSGFEVVNFYGVLAPKGMQKPLVARLYGDIIKALNMPGVKERMASEGTNAVGSTPENFSAFLRSEIVKWNKVVKAANVRGE
jgi:tripartite-type tricarboxylate transporter receptor subunit TctC